MQAAPHTAGQDGQDEGSPGHTPGAGGGHQNEDDCSVQRPKGSKVGIFKALL